MTDPPAEERDAGALRRGIAGWIRDRVEEAGLRGAVFGLSGGVDSAVVCGLAAEALGAERCLGLIMPVESAPEDARLGQRVADRFGVEALRVELDGPFRSLLQALADHRERAERLARGVPDAGAARDPSAGENAERLARANLKPRLRMVALYYYANLLGYLVLGCGNRAELAVGYFSKWGDSGADALPLGDLLKSEVRALARELGVPAEVAERPPTAGLWAGQTDEQELGMTYDQIDRYLRTGTSGDARVDARIRELEAGCAHKRRMPPIARPG